MRFLLLLAALSAALPSEAQVWGTVTGFAFDATTLTPLPGVTVLVDGTNFGTATQADGRYLLRLPAGRFALRFSSVGYAPVTDSVTVVQNPPTELTVRLKPVAVELEEVTVVDQSAEGAGIQRIKPKHVRAIPTPFKGFQALASLPGVAATNELSNQYSVRGGGFNENLIFVNGFEVYMPFRPRQGEQEGLGLLNPDLARRITLYTGGFPARYGGKISSSLDIRYAASDTFRASTSVSLLDASATASATHGALAWIASFRKAQAKRFFATQELKGNYEPNYTDVQGLFRWSISSAHTLEGLGIWARHAFALDPRSRRTYYGTVRGNRATGNLKSVWIQYDDRSSENDGYVTQFGGIRLLSSITPSVTVEHDVSVFRTDETELLLLLGNSIIYDVVTDPNGDYDQVPRGNAQQEDVADNRVRVTTTTLKGRYEYLRGRHLAEAGWQVRRLLFEDQIDEASTVSGVDTDGDPVRIVVDSVRATARLSEMQTGLYAQDAVQVAPGFIVTAGMRADYFSFNREWTVSPRFFMRLQASEHLNLAGSIGLYHQAPTYRELRGTPEAGAILESTLNRDIRSQRSLQAVAGGELFLPLRRLYVRAEAYWKSLSRVISYSLENVRINYSGQNDAQAYAWGLDLQARGEFVPGLESWVNYGLLVTHEQFLARYQTPQRTGWNPRPTDQRHTISVYIQDYIPTDKSWKLHLRAIYGSGLPYTPPIPGTRVGSVVTQMPGRRLSERYPSYRRMDFGATKELSLPIAAIELTAEVLNIFDVTNTVAFSWVPDGSGIWQRIPTRLTPRTVNVRIRATL